MSRRGTSVNAPGSISNATPRSSSRTSKVDRSSQGLSQAGSRQPNSSRASSVRGSQAAPNSAQRRTRDFTAAAREEKKPKAPWDTPSTSSVSTATPRRTYGTEPGKRNVPAGNAPNNSSLTAQSNATPAPQQPPVPQLSGVVTGQARGRSLPAPLPEAALRSRTPSRPNPLLGGSTSVSPPGSASGNMPSDLQAGASSTAALTTALTRAPAAQGRNVPTPSFQDPLPQEAVPHGSGARTPSRGPARPNPLLGGSPKRERSSSRGPAVSDLGLFGNAAGDTDEIHLKVETESIASSSRDSRGRKSTRELRRSKERQPPDTSMMMTAPAAFLSSMFAPVSEPLSEEGTPPRAVHRGSSSARRKSVGEGQAKRGRSSRADLGTQSAPTTQRVGKPVEDRKLAPWDMDTASSLGDSPKQQAPGENSSHETVPPSALKSLSGERKDGSGPRVDFTRSGSGSSNSFSLTPSFSNKKTMNRTAEFGVSSEDTISSVRKDSKGKEKAKEEISHSSMTSTDRRNRRAVIQEVSSPISHSSSRPARQISGFRLAGGDEGSPQKTKVPLACLATNAPLAVRLTHVQDLASTPVNLLGAKVPAYGQMGCLLHEQRALGEPLARIDAVALARWYLPYLLLALCYVGSIIVAGLTSEILLLCMPLFVSLPVLHHLRLWRCDRLLCIAVDTGALIEFQEQLKSPLGWGTANAVFSGTLTAAMQAFQPAPRKLVAHPRYHFFLAPVILAGLGLVLLGMLRILRTLDTAVPPEVEIAVSGVALVTLISLGCSPLGVRSRSSEVDLRLSVIEAGFNTLLDTLRPLVADMRSGPALGASRKIAEFPSQFAPPQSPHSITAASGGRFSVRLVTSDRNTLRATLHICGPGQWSRPDAVAVKQDSGAAICVSCALGGFSIMAEHLEGATPMDLGASAVGTELGGHAGASPQGLTSLAATMGINLGRDPRIRQRADDEVSVSLASVSTASTLRRGGNNGPSPAAMTKAMGMVSKLSARKDPLEVFRVATGVDRSIVGAVVPAKVPLDEPSLLLSLSEGKSDVLSGAQCPVQLMRFVADAPAERAWSACRRLLRPSIHVPREAEDNLGVLRSDMELRLLCHANKGVGPFGTASPSSRPATTPCSRKEDSDLDTSSDDEERNRPNPVDGHLMTLSNHTSKHLAVIFDSIEDRNHCLAMLVQVRLMPEKAAAAEIVMATTNSGDSGPWP